MYAIDVFDCLRIAIRDEGAVRNKAVYLAIGMRCSGLKEVLGIWIEQTKGAKFWLRGMTEIRNRGTHDVLIAVVDGLKGFPEAINAVFPEALVQTCIVHLIRYSMQLASWEERKAIESLHSQVRKAVRGHGHFPNDEAATKLIWLALRNVTAKWKNPPIAWHAAKAQFAIQVEDRFVMTQG